MEKKESLAIKLKNGLHSLKSHWKTPPNGYYVNYKDFCVWHSAAVLCPF